MLLFFDYWWVSWWPGCSLVYVPRICHSSLNGRAHLLPALLLLVFQMLLCQAIQRQTWKNNLITVTAVCHWSAVHAKTNSSDLVTDYLKVISYQVTLVCPCGRWWHGFCLSLLRYLNLNLICDMSEFSVNARNYPRRLVAITDLSPRIILCPNKRGSTFSYIESLGTAPGEKKHPRPVRYYFWKCQPLRARCCASQSVVVLLWNCLITGQSITVTDFPTPSVVQLPKQVTQLFPSIYGRRSGPVSWLVARGTKVLSCATTNIYCSTGQ